MTTREREPFSPCRASKCRNKYYRPLLYLPSDITLFLQLVHCSSMRRDAWTLVLQRDLCVLSMFLLTEQWWSIQTLRVISNLSEIWHPKNLHTRFSGQCTFTTVKIVSKSKKSLASSTIHTHPWRQGCYESIYYLPLQVNIRVPPHAWCVANRCKVQSSIDARLDVVEGLLQARALFLACLIVFIQNLSTLKSDLRT